MSARGYLKKVGDREARQFVHALAAGLGEQQSHKGGDGDCDGKDADQDEVGCEHRVDQILGQELEEQEESQQHSTADQGEGHRVLHGREMHQTSLLDCMLHKMRRLGVGLGWVGGGRGLHERWVGGRGWGGGGLHASEQWLAALVPRDSCMLERLSYLIFSKLSVAYRFL